MLFPVRHSSLAFRECRTEPRSTFPCKFHISEIRDILGKSHGTGKILHFKRYYHLACRGSGSGGWFLIDKNPPAGLNATKHIRTRTYTQISIFQIYRPISIERLNSVLIESLEQQTTSLIALLPAYNHLKSFYGTKCDLCVPV